jgi:hypothetical protein
MPETVRRIPGLYPVLRVYVVSIAVRANNFKFASGKAAARPMKVPLSGTPTGAILT